MIRSPYICFNLAIEILLISPIKRLREPNRQTILFQSRNRDTSNFTFLGFWGGLDIELVSISQSRYF